MSNDMSMDEMIEVLARYRYNAKHDADRIKALEAEASGLRAAVASLERVDNLLIKGLKDELNTLRASSFVTAVPVEEYEKLKAEVAKSEEHNAALCERLQDLNGEVHTASCTNARLHSLFANSEQENARLKAEVERLRKAGDDLSASLTVHSNHPNCGARDEWLRAKKGLPSLVQQWEREKNNNDRAAKEGKQS